MDPAVAAAAVAAFGVPRTRGDGPSGLPVASDFDAGSPHTRGWTPRAGAGDRLHVGFPAHAGMDPTRPGGSRTARWVPRTRGDGPSIPPQAPRRMTGSPHTRGWTRPGRGSGCRDPGFPAHAGMDRTSSTRRTGSRRVPRTRGDGPADSQGRLRGVKGSPHTRGWTQIVEESRRASCGFPAHAGMDPGPRTAPPAPCRVPRTRGDGPHARSKRAPPAAGSPHTRGWTCHIRRADTVRFGFPAHAGMDPGSAASGRATGRVPRTRGDGPSSSAPPARPAGGSPHTRGWTRGTGPAGVRRGGFPAHAGMDPLRVADADVDDRVPRTRGDGPEVVHRGPLHDEGSPHTRGWTPALRRRRGGGRGFPAHAGMDPLWVVNVENPSGVPRTRGDGPINVSGASLLDAGSPHTRGWTASTLIRTPSGWGFPAHAGMDPSSSCAGTGRRRVPRTRGDGPGAQRSTRCTRSGSPHTRGWTDFPLFVRQPAAGFPAHAGMDPDHRAAARHRPWVPRTRGDGPAGGTTININVRGSPHTRGWTLNDRMAITDDEGFPAHAGMDPGSSSSSSPPARVPRTRGDGPATQPWALPRRRGSPHTRGWTRAPRLRDAVVRGFPAHAGMDPPWRG